MLQGRNLSPARLCSFLCFTSISNLATCIIFFCIDDDLKFSTHLGVGFLFFWTEESSRFVDPRITSSWERLLLKCFWFFGSSVSPFSQGIHNSFKSGAPLPAIYGFHFFLSFVSLSFPLEFDTFLRVILYIIISIFFFPVVSCLPFQSPIWIFNLYLHLKFSCIFIVSHSPFYISTCIRFFLFLFPLSTSRRYLGYTF